VNALSHLPLFADLRGRDVLVIGAGEVAARKVALLERAGARILVVAPALGPALEARITAGAVKWLAPAFLAGQLDGCALVVAATDDVHVNATVATAARLRGLPVNVVDDTALSTVILPAIIDRSPLLIAVSTGGAAPVLARRLRAEIETRVDGAWAGLIALAARWRTRIRGRLPDLQRRREFYDALVDGPAMDALRAGRPLEAEAALARALSHDAGAAHPAAGLVTLVGAGPGDPGLLTINALRALQRADVILHDALVSDEILDLARRDALRIPVGKRAGGRQTAQAQIHALMLEHARVGRCVVRLKGGDPFIFGRGGEELEFLRAHGIAYDVVPGITAATACAAYAGIPLTHRDHAQSVRFVTAHCHGALDSLDWAGLAHEGQTLAMYMGARQAHTIQAQLIAHGRAAATPVAIVESGTRPDQRVLTGILGGLAGLVGELTPQAPALIVIGEVARFASVLGWFGEQPRPALHPASAPSGADACGLAVAGGT